MKFRADLHIHTCLSPCADLAMSPRAIVARARQAGLNAIAICDHNSALNTPALETICRAEGLAALYGLEVMTRELCHCLCLFDHAEQALALGRQVGARMKSIPIRGGPAGQQVVVNEHDEIRQIYPLALGQPADIGFLELQEQASKAGGLFIPAHVNRPAFGALAQLGHLPGGDYVAVEVMAATAHQDIPGLPAQLPRMVSSDAHQLEAIGRAWIEFESPALSVVSLSDVFRSGQPALGIAPRK